MNGYTIRYSARARHIIARRHPDGTITVTLPAGTDPARNAQVIDSLVARIASRPITRTGPLFSLSTEISLPGISVRFARHDGAPGTLKAVRGRNSECEIIIMASPDITLEDSATEKAVSRLLLRVAHSRAASVLLPRARELAERIGASPRQWLIGHGRRTLGSCSADGTIRISETVLFLPAELRDYVICHELAHLTEMNHSPRFHALCNAYCGGREAALRRALRSYRWPIVRV